MADTGSLRYLVPLMGNVGSFVGCYWVLARLRTLGSLRSSRLFPRLLASLALADLLFHFGYGLDEIFTFFGSSSPRAVTGYCSGIALWLRSFEFVSALQASYISMHFVLQSFHCMPSLRTAKCFVTVCWALGVGLALLDFLINPWNYDRQEGVCLPGLDLDPIPILVLTSCFLLSCFSYALVIYRSYKRTPDSVLQRALRRASMYPVTFIITYALLLLCFFDRSLFQNDFFAAIAYTMQSCNGLLNACSYACQGRYSVHVEREEVSQSLHDENDGITASKIVQVGGEEVIEYLMGTSITGSGTRSSRIVHSSSF